MVEGVIFGLGCLFFLGVAVTAWVGGFKAVENLDDDGDVVEVID